MCKCVGAQACLVRGIMTCLVSLNSSWPIFSPPHTIFPTALSVHTSYPYHFATNREHSHNYKFMPSANVVQQTSQIIMDMSFIA